MSEAEVQDLHKRIRIELELLWHLLALGIYGAIGWHLHKLLQKSEVQKDEKKQHFFNLDEYSISN